MKHLKISMFAVVAIVMGIAASAFTSSKSVNFGKEPLTYTWFKFTGDPTNLSQIQDYTNYSYVNGLPCSGSNLICAVEANGTASMGQHPSAPFSSTLKTELANEFNHTGSYPDISQKP